MEKIYSCNINIENKNINFSKIIDEINDSSMVLDVGCAVGYLGKCLSENKNCTMVGIDYSQEELKLAKKQMLIKI